MARPEIKQYPAGERTVIITRSTDSYWAYEVFMSMNNKYLNMVIIEGVYGDGDVVCSSCRAEYRDHDVDDLNKTITSKNGCTEFEHPDRSELWEEFAHDQYDGGRGEGCIFFVIQVEGPQGTEDIAVVGGWPMAERVKNDLLKHFGAERPDPELLANEFCRIIHANYADVLPEIISRNKAETSAGVCHTHDFFDANMVMHDACLKFGFNPLAQTTDALRQTDIEIFNKAWDIAKARDFKYVPVRSAPQDLRKRGDHYRDAWLVTESALDSIAHRLTAVAVALELGADDRDNKDAIMRSSARLIHTIVDEIEGK